MQNLKLILIVLSLNISSCPLSAQNAKQYYIEIPDPANVPEVFKKDNNVILKFSDERITELFGNHFILNFRRAFPEAKNSILRTVYIIECDSELIEYINDNYPHIFPKTREVPVVEPLFMPNDLGTNGGVLLGQPELNFVGAVEAWDISHGDNVIIGIAETMNVFHEDLIGKSNNIIGSDPSPTSMAHGTQVGLIAGASTNNNIGMASMGFNASINSYQLSYQGLIPLANSGARVINMSWGSCYSVAPASNSYEQLVIDEVWGMGVVLVAAAGNGQHSCGSQGPGGKHYPASLKHVIAVTNVGHQYEIGTSGVDQRQWKNIHLNPYPPYNATHNDAVDMSAPGLNILTGAPYQNGSAAYEYGGGTSYSAPMVTGTIALMFAANPCLFPDEVESILKLTAFKNDTIQQNLAYIGELGAGRLDSYRAVDMANDMQLSNGTVEIMDRIIDRWDFNLRTSPYEIKMINNIVSDGATLNLTAKNNIDILSGDYSPDSMGYMDLKIDSENNICNTPLTESQNAESNARTRSIITSSRVYPNPNNGSFSIALGKEFSGSTSFEIVDVFGKLIYKGSSREHSFDVEIPNLASGMYTVKLFSNGYSETLRFIKE